MAGIMARDTQGCTVAYTSKDMTGAGIHVPVMLYHREWLESTRSVKLVAFLVLDKMNEVR